MLVKDLVYVVFHKSCIVNSLNVEIGFGLFLRYHKVPPVLPIRILRSFDVCRSVHSNHLSNYSLAFA